MKCVEMQWMAMLVGSESCGKNTLVAMVARLCGKSLRVLSMNSGMDTTDFIGGFEQLNIQEDVRNVCRSAVAHIDRYLSQSNNLNLHGASLLQFTTSFNNIIEGRQEPNEKEIGVVNHMTNILGQLKVYLGSVEGGLDGFDTVENLFQDVQKKSLKSVDGGGVFQWVDSVLVECLRNGDWLLVENVNACTASILDRLNGLLEPNGVLSVDERGVVDGDIPKVKPHPEFRLFMSMDPRFGEISRAMRNRGVEIYISQNDDGAMMDDIDVGLMLKGLLKGKSDIADQIQSLYTVIRDMDNSDVKLSSLLKTASMASVLISNGDSENESVRKACTEILFRSAKRSTAEDIFSSASMCCNDFAELLPSLSEFSSSTALATLNRICLPLRMLDEGEESNELHKFLITFERLPAKYKELGWKLMEDIGKTAFLEPSKTLAVPEALPEYLSVGDRSTCEALNDADVVSATRRYFFTLLRRLRGFEEVLSEEEGRVKSVMSMSQQYHEGRLAATRLPHPSVMYFYRLCKAVTDFTSHGESLHLDTTATWSQCEDAYVWFDVFVAFCRRNLSTSAFSSHTFYVNQFSVHWKWVYEKFFAWMGPKLDEETGMMVRQIDQMLGHDSLTYLLINVANTLGVPKAYSFEEQFQLVQELSEAYEMVRSSRVQQESYMEKILLSGKNISLANVFSPDMKEAVDNLKEEISNNMLTSTSKDSKNVELALRTLFNLCSHVVCSATGTGTGNVSPTEVQEMCRYGVFTNSAGFDSLCQWSLFNDFISTTTDESTHMWMDLLNGLYETHLPNTASFFLEDDEIRQGVVHPYVSPCAPILGIYKKLFICEKQGTGLQLHVPLNEVTTTLKELKKLHQMLWSNIETVSTGTQQFIHSLLLISFLHVVRVIEAFSKVTQSSLLFDIAKAISLTLETVKSKSSDSLLQLMKEFVISISSRAEFPDTITSVLSQLSEVLSSTNEDNNMVAVGSVACLCGLVVFEVTKVMLKYDPIEEVQQRMTHLQEQLQSVDSELELRYVCMYLFV